MLTTPLALLAFAALSTAAPTRPSPGHPVDTEPPYKAWENNVTFDDYVPLTDTNGVGHQIGPYRSLSFQGIENIFVGLESRHCVEGVIPQSSSNVGAYGLMPNITQTIPKITSDSPYSKTEFFDLQEFYFGCVAGNVTSVRTSSPAVDCELIVAGYKANKEVARQTFKFPPELDMDAAMTKAELGNGFKRIDTATFESKYDVTDAASATLLDNMKYTAYTLDEDYANDADDDGKNNDDHVDNTHEASSQDQSQNGIVVTQAAPSGLQERGHRDDAIRMKCRRKHFMSSHIICDVPDGAPWDYSKKDGGWICKTGFASIKCHFDPEKAKPAKHPNPPPEGNINDIGTIQDPSGGYIGSDGAPGVVCDTTQVSKSNRLDYHCQIPDDAPWDDSKFHGSWICGPEGSKSKKIRCKFAPDMANPAKHSRKRDVSHNILGRRYHGPDGGPGVKCEKLGGSRFTTLKYHCEIPEDAPWDDSKVQGGWICGPEHFGSEKIRCKFNPKKAKDVQKRDLAVSQSHDEFKKP